MKIEIELEISEAELLTMLDNKDAKVSLNPDKPEATQNKPSTYVKKGYDANKKRLEFVNKKTKELRNNGSSYMDALRLASKEWKNLTIRPVKKARGRPKGVKNTPKEEANPLKPFTPTFGKMPYLKPVKEKLEKEVIYMLKKTIMNGNSDVMELERKFLELTPGQWNEFLVSVIANSESISKYFGVKNLFGIEDNRISFG